MITSRSDTIDHLVICPSKYLRPNGYEKLCNRDKIILHKTQVSSGLTIDVTTRYETELREREHIRQIEQSRAISRFLTSASHDLRTPLSVLNTTTYLLEKSTEGRANHLIERLKLTIERLSRTLEDMFYIVRLDETSKTLDPINAENLLTDMASHFASVSNFKNRSFVTDIQLCEKTRLYANAETLGRAISNIFDNAVQNTNDGGQIKFRVSCKENYELLIEIQDDGKGISESDLPHIWDHFYRVESHRPLDNQNIGLGLTIARRVIESLNGKISVESTVGKGTTVLVKIPISSRSYN